MTEKPGTFELMEPPSPEALVPDSWVEPWMIVVAVLLVALLLIGYGFMRKKVPAFDPQAARDAAYADALRALAAVDSAQSRETAVQVSWILRKYLSVAAADPALFETHEETLARHEAFHGFSDDARQAAAAGFSRLASLKYSPAHADVAADTVTAESKTLLETLHHGFRK